MSLFGAEKLRPGYSADPKKEIYPFNARLGALMSLNVIDIIPLSLKPMITVLPSATDKFVVEKLSKFTLFDLECARLHFKDFILQIHSKENVPQDAMLLVYKESIFLSSEEDCEIWLGEQGLLVDQKINCYDTQFDRVWGNPDKQFISKIHVNEKFQEADGTFTFSSQDCMLYSRPIDEDTLEFLFLSFDKKNAKINVYTGVELDTTSFTVY